jgi:hypothetical protein
VNVLARISTRLLEASTGRVTLVALAVFVLFMLLVLPRQAAETEARTGGGRQPDSSFLYSAAALYEMAEAFGPEGRQAYIRARFTFDLVWPLVYAFFLVTALSWLSARAFPAESAWRRLNLVPLLGMAFDYLENVSASLVMARYPAQTPLFDLLAPAFTAVKWIFVAGSFVILAGVVAAAAVRQLTRRLR